MSDTEMTLILGRLQGSMEIMLRCQDEHGILLYGLDARLGRVEQRSAAYGAVSGGLMSAIAQYFGVSMGAPG